MVHGNPSIKISKDFNQKSEDKTAYNSGLAKVEVQYSADSFVVNQTLVLRINICGKTPPSPSRKTLPASVDRHSCIYRADI
jgi:hypothetical protein